MARLRLHETRRPSVNRARSRARVVLYFIFREETATNCDKLEAAFHYWVEIARKLIFRRRKPQLNWGFRLLLTIVLRVLATSCCQNAATSEGNAVSNFEVRPWPVASIACDHPLRHLIDDEASRDKFAVLLPRSRKRLCQAHRVWPVAVLAGALASSRGSMRRAWRTRWESRGSRRAP